MNRKTTPPSNTPPPPLIPGFLKQGLPYKFWGGWYRQKIGLFQFGIEPAKNRVEFFQINRENLFSGNHGVPPGRLGLSYPFMVCMDPKGGIFWKTLEIGMVKIINAVAVLTAFCMTAAYGRAKDSTWCLVYQASSGTRAIGIAGDASFAIHETVPQPAEAAIKFDRMPYQSGFRPSVVSPDGKKVAHVLTSIFAAAHGLVAISDFDGSNLVTLNQPDEWCDGPCWLSDSKQLLFHRHGSIGRGGKREIVLYDVVTRQHQPFSYPDIALNSGIVTLPDGRLLCVRRTKPKNELAILDPAKKIAPEILAEDIGEIDQLGVMPDGKVVWMRSRESLKLIDRATKKVIRNWPMATFIKPEWNGLVKKFLARPDGGGFAFTVYPFFTEHGKTYPCQKVIVVINLGTDGDSKLVNYLPMEQGGELLQWHREDSLVKTKPLTDDAVRKLAGFDLDNELARGKDLLSIRILDVVPSGETRPRGAVFQKLGITDSNLSNYREEGINLVKLLKWNISPSYDIVCMTGATTQPHLPMTDPKREVYGIRIVKKNGID